MKKVTRTVAIVDDLYFFRETASRYLTLLGFKILLEAGNGIELLRLLKASSNLPDACLVDMEMPVMDGLATTRALRERYPSIKIIAFTLSHDQAAKERFLKMGAHAVLFKGMDPTELKDALLRSLVL